MENYIEERLQKQKKWYEEKANQNTKLFFSYQTVIIILGATIPVIVALETVIKPLVVWGGPITAVISAIIAIYAGLDKLKQPQPNWFNYRANEEMIKKEEWFYKFRAGVYRDLNEEEANNFLVERIESIISADIARMTSLTEKREKPEENRVEP